MTRRLTRSETPPATPGAAAAEVGAVLLAAQAQARRGLREGPAALESARCAYLSAQWTGEHDRRPERGLLVRTKL